MFLVVDDHLLHVTLSGPSDAPALVLLHSLGTSAALWDTVAEHFSDSHRIVRPDFRGHGLSETSRVPVTIDKLADDVLESLDHLGVARFALAGISIGGLVAQVVAARAGRRVSGLVLFDTSLASLGPDMWRSRAAAVRANGLNAIAAEVAGRWLPPGTESSPAARAHMRLLAATDDEGYAAGCDALAVADCSALVERLTMPTTIVVGSEDKATPPAAAAALARAVPGSRVQVIEGAAHLPLLHKPQAVIAAMSAALSPGRVEPR